MSPNGPYTSTGSAAYSPTTAKFAKRKRPAPNITVRSTTILLLVHQLEDVAPAAALCALLGDLYRRRTLYDSKDPIPVIRVAVTPALRHFFLSSHNNNTTTILSWRAHETSSSSSSAGWNKTHVGAPDSIWCLDSALHEAFYGISTTSSSSADPFRHDDGGMADMILIPTASSAQSLILWQKLAQLVQSLPKLSRRPSEITTPPPPPPLVIATLGNLAGIDWQSRMAFAIIKEATLDNRTGSKQQHNHQQRPLALIGFPSPLWYCRLVPGAQLTNAKTITTRYTKPHGVVLMVGHRDSSSSSEVQPVLMMFTSSSSSSSQAEDAALRLLRQTIFPPQTNLKTIPVFERLQQRQPNISAKDHLHALIWSLLQDPHWIQFPCYMATACSDATSQNNGTEENNNTQPQSVGSLILAVLEEVLQLVRQVSLDLQKRHHHHGTSSRPNTLLHALTDPMLLTQSPSSLLAKLLGLVGTLVEDVTQNRISELMYRLSTTTTTTTQTKILQQTWLLGPLLTRAAHSEWHRIMIQSPYHHPKTTTKASATTTTTTVDPMLLGQLQKDTIDCGLGLIMQLGEMHKVQMPTIHRLVHQHHHHQSIAATTQKVALPIPLKAWCGISSPLDLERFLTCYPPLGGDAPTSTKQQRIGIQRQHQSLNVPLKLMSRL